MGFTRLDSTYNHTTDTSFIVKPIFSAIYKTSTSNPDVTDDPEICLNPLWITLILGKIASATLLLNILNPHCVSIISGRPTIIFLNTILARDMNCLIRGEPLRFLFLDPITISYILLSGEFFSKYGSNLSISSIGVASSISVNNLYSPFATSMPFVTAPALPVWWFLIRMSWGYSLLKFSINSSLPSFDPSSTTITS